MATIFTTHLPDPRTLEEQAQIDKLYPDRYAYLLASPTKEFAPRDKFGNQKIAPLSSAVIGIFQLAEINYDATIALLKGIIEERIKANPSVEYQFKPEANALHTRSSGGRRQQNLIYTINPPTDEINDAAINLSEKHPAIVTQIRELPTEELVEINRNFIDQHEMIKFYKISSMQIIASQKLTTTEHQWAQENGATYEEMMQAKMCIQKDLSKHELDILAITTNQQEDFSKILPSNYSLATQIYQYTSKQIENALIPEQEREQKHLDSYGIVDLRSKLLSGPTEDSLSKAKGAMLTERVSQRG